MANVKLIEIKKHEYETSAAEGNKKYIVAQLFASTKSDVGSDMEIDGLPASHVISAGSYVITASGEIGLLDFDGTWKWIGDEEEASTKSAVLMQSFTPTEQQDNEQPEDEQPISEPEDDMR